MIQPFFLSIHDDKKLLEGNSDNSFHDISGKNQLIVPPIISLNDNVINIPTLGNQPSTLSTVSCVQNLSEAQQKREELHSAVEVI